jgi:hypothetical protein
MRMILWLLVVSSTACAAAPTGLDDLLRRTGKSVESFWNRLGSVNCVETVKQTSLGKGSKIIYGKESTFDYLIVLQLSGTDLVVDESRVPVKPAVEMKKPPQANFPLLVTNGFATLQFVFHPFFQDDFEYSRPQPVQLAGSDLVTVAFRHIHGARSPSVLKLRNREYPLDWEGTAWIEPETGAIVRIAAGVASSMQDVGLQALNADVRYERMEFKESPGPQRLPAVATVEAETVRRHWRNVHTFTNYRLFSVDVKTATEAPK